MPLIRDPADAESSPRPRRFRRLLDWAVYLVIAVVFAAAMMGFGMYQGRTGGASALPVKWMGFAGLTLIVFGYTIRDYRAFWKRDRFWLVMSTLFLGHVIVGILILEQFEVVPLLVLAAVAAIESNALAAWIGHWLITRPAPKINSNRKQHSERDG